MCSERHTIHGAAPALRLGQLDPAGGDGRAGHDAALRVQRRGERALHAREHRRRRGDARLLQGQSGHRPRLRRRGRAGRRAEDHLRRLRAHRAWAGRRTSRASGCSPTSSPSRRCTCGATTSATPALYGPGAKVPLKPFTGTIGLAPAEPGLHSVVPPRRVGGNLDMRDLAAGVGALAAGGGGGRAVLGRRHPCGAGRRRGLRHGDRERDGGDADLRAGEGGEPRLPALPDAGTGDAAQRRRRLRRDDRHRAGPDGGRPGRGVGDDRPAERRGRR